MIPIWKYRTNLGEILPYHVDVQNQVQLAMAVGWIIAEGSAFAVTPNIWSRTYRLWMSETSFRVIVRKVDSHVLG